MGRDSVIDTWGSSEEERAASYPCDGIVPSPDRVLFRAVDVDAPVELAFRWLCQLRVAPYSYDWVDNRGRRSPRQLVDGLDDLEVGQPVMTIFRLVSFEDGRSITLESNTQRFGHLVVTYVASARGPGESRLIVKLIVRARRGLVGLVMRRLLRVGDLIMMRKQLLTLKALAERDAVGL